MFNKYMSPFVCKPDVGSLVVLATTIALLVISEYGPHVQSGIRHKSPRKRMQLILV
jgi:hypothetical protein